MAGGNSPVSAPPLAALRARHRGKQPRVQQLIQQLSRVSGESRACPVAVAGRSTTGPRSQPAVNLPRQYCAAMPNSGAGRSLAGRPAQKPGSSMQTLDAALAFETV